MPPYWHACAEGLAQWCKYGGTTVPEAWHRPVRTNVRTKIIVIEGKQRIESIILQADACFVGIIDLGGSPYVIPMNLGYEGDTLHLHSGPEGGKIEMLQRNNNVYITFSLGHKLVYQHKQVACSYSIRLRSAMCREKIGFIKDMEEKHYTLDVIMRHYTKDQFSCSDPAVRNVKVQKVPVDQTTGKIFGLRADKKP